MGVASVNFLVYSRYGILIFLLLDSQDNSLQAVWPLREGARKLIRFVLILGGLMTDIECNPSIHVIVLQCGYFW